MTRTISFSFFLLLILTAGAQPQVIDRVIAIVGKYPILKSDLQTAMVEQEKQEMRADKCQAFELLLYQKLLLSQADKDSVTVTDAEVDTELGRRMAYFISQFGSEEKLEKYYGKRTNVLKDELRSEVQEQLIADKMESKVSGETAKLTPAEVRQFFNTIPEDSLPLINSEVELQQLVRKPVFSAEAKKEARDLLESYRQRVLNGQTSMSTLARLYSEDPSSAKEGGLITNVAKGQMVPEFEGVAFRLKKGEVSNVFESTYGFHFIELVQRKGELLDLRHILVMPKMSNADFFRCKQQLDSIYTEIKEGRITFEDAVKKFSDDADTKQNAGLMINAQTASTRFDNETLSQIDPKLIVTINSMSVGDISTPVQFMGPDGKPGFRVLKLKNRIDPHKANLKDDYQRLLLMATAAKKRSDVRNWIRSHSKNTYIRIDAGFSCTFQNDWVINN
jgi:peptidyl-prolyl cis-trans isomerase SurA